MFLGIQDQTLFIHRAFEMNGELRNPDWMIFHPDQLGCAGR
jgi:hypothetical protein